jgi:hypothetical protein
MAARAAHRRYCTTAWREQGGGDGEGTPVELTEESAPGVDGAQLAHVLANDCLLPLDDRQELLEQTCPALRLRLVRRLMVREAELLGTLHAVWAPTAKFAVDHSPN